MTHAPPAPTPPAPLTPAEKRRKRAKALAFGAAALLVSSLLGSFIPGKGEIVKAAILGAAVFADPDDAEAIESWVDRTSASLGATGEWSTANWAAAARRNLDATIVEKREQERAQRALSEPVYTPAPMPTPVELTDSQKAALAESQAALDEINRKSAETWETWLSARCTGSYVRSPRLHGVQIEPDDEVCVEYRTLHPDAAQPN